MDGESDVKSMSGVKAFVSLTDAPSAYAGKALQLVRVNAGETALEFAVGGGGATIAYGTFTGNSTVNRAIAHGLGAIPSCVLICASSGTVNWNRIIRGLAAIFYANAGTFGNHAVTTPDATNFYVGNGVSFAQSANLDTIVYYWCAF